MIRRTTQLPALVLALALVAAGCGGGEDPAEDAEAQPLSKAEFTTQANKICADGNAEIEAGAEPMSEEPTEQELEEFATDVLVPSIQGQHDDITALGAPEGDEDEVKAMLDALQDGVDAVEADPSTLTSSEDPFEPATDLAEAYGLSDCAV